MMAIPKIFGDFRVTTALDPVEYVLVQDVFCDSVCMDILQQCFALRSYWQVIQDSLPSHIQRLDGSDPGAAQRLGIWPGLIAKPETVLSVWAMHLALAQVQQHSDLQNRQLFYRLLRNIEPLTMLDGVSHLWSFYHRGDYYKSHKDSTLTTMIYYPPMPPGTPDRTGGDLIFPLDWLQEPREFKPDIKPNSLIIFSADLDHQVTELASDGVDPGVLRISITQFLWPKQATIVSSNARETSRVDHPTR